MRLVKGRSRKNIAMAELFNQEKGDYFLDYGKGVYATGGMLYSEDLFFMTEKMSSVKALTIELYEFIEKEKENKAEFNIFIDGNFSEDNLDELHTLEQRVRGLKLTVSVQTNEDSISILEFK